MRSKPSGMVDACNGIYRQPAGRVKLRAAVCSSLRDFEGEFWVIWALALKTSERVRYFVMHREVVSMTESVEA
jgi:hypothetical protein